MVILLDTISLRNNTPKVQLLYTLYPSGNTPKLNYFLP